MKTKFSGLLKASAVAISLIGSTAIVATFTFPDIAYAKEGKGGGNGGGKGGGKGGGNDGGVVKMLDEAIVVQLFIILCFP